MKYFIALLTTLFVQGCSVFGIRTVEILDYEIVEKEGRFDVRQYDDYWVIRAEADGSYEESRDQAFRKLFAYISGKNRQEEKISMTGPVLQQEKGEKIAMTGPVLQQKSETGWSMEFVLPSKYNDSGPPEPLDAEVSVVKVKGFKAAALSYSGSLGEDKYRDKVEELLAEVKSRGLNMSGEPFSAGYDPPWTIPFLRRNEVLVRIE